MLAQFSAICGATVKTLGAMCVGKKLHFHPTEAPMDAAFSVHEVIHWATSPMAAADCR